MFRHRAANWDADIARKIVYAASATAIVICLAGVAIEPALAAAVAFLAGHIVAAAMALRVLRQPADSGSRNASLSQPFQPRRAYWVAAFRAMRRSRPACDTHARCLLPCTNPPDAQANHASHAANSLLSPLLHICCRAT